MAHHGLLERQLLEAINLIDQREIAITQQIFLALLMMAQELFLEFTDPENVLALAKKQQKVM